MKHNSTHKHVKSDQLLDMAMHNNFPNFPSKGQPKMKSNPKSI